MLLIVGLGNPGDEYRDTRHNVGFRVVDELARRHNLSFKRTRWRAQGANGAVRGEPVMLLKPQTYMNESGYSVRGAAAFHKVPPADVLVVHDDIDLPLGRLRFRENGSAGGNNGIKSVINHLRTQEFPRLKLGVGRPRQFEHAADHVLSPFRGDEIPAIADAINRAADAVECFLLEGRATAMNRYNV